MRHYTVLDRVYWIDCIGLSPYTEMYWFETLWMYWIDCIGLRHYNVLTIVD